MRRLPHRIPLVALVALLPLAPARASIAIYMPPEDLARAAPVVVEGRVASSRSGLDPATGALSTYTTIDVDAILRGPRSFDRVVIREPGGAYGEVVHEVDAVPTYVPGERVLVFLETAPDGALRTTGMFFGKFSLSGDERGSPWADRDLDGRGLLPTRTLPAVERLAHADLRAVVESVPWRGATARSRAAPARATPPELDRVSWADADAADGDAVAPFTTLSGSHPTRWFQIDQGTPIKLQIEPLRDPLGSADGAIAALVRAMDAWTEVPEARVTVRPGDTDVDFTTTHALSPAKANSGWNIVLFGDPYDDIPDPTSCTGILAIGGYWRTASLGGAVNGASFHSALSMYVVFNDGFECFLGDPDDLAEIAAHEIGHGLGFGHSSAPDAIMRSSAYGARGPRLGDDDRDAAHCIYPHRLTLAVPNGGESWEAGSVHATSWSSTVEDGPDGGVVSLEHSGDGGASWTRVAEGTANDGLWSWIVPAGPGADQRFRVVRPNRNAAASAPFPSACSADASNAPFTITPRVPRAGVVPDGTAATPGLTVDRGFAGALVLNWSPSCSADATDYALYEGSLDSLRRGEWDHAPVVCSTTGDPWAAFLPGAGDRFYLIAARTADHEGRLGRSSSGAWRPQAASACVPRETLATCE